MKLKRIVAAALAAMVFMSAAIPSYAASKGEIMAEIEAGVVVNGRTIYAPNKYVAMAQSYLNSHNLTDAQLTRILNAVQIVKVKVAKKLSEKENANSQVNSSSVNSAVNHNGTTSGQPAGSASTTASSKASMTGTASADSYAGTPKINTGSALPSKTDDAIIKSFDFGNKNLTTQQRLALSSAVVEVAEAAGATVTTNGDNVVIVDKYGNTYNVEQANPIKDTGIHYSWIPAILAASSIVVVVIGSACVFIWLKKKRLNAGGESI